MTAVTRGPSPRRAASAPRRIALLSATVAVLVAAGAVQGVAAASPSASVAPDASDPGEPGGISLQAWLDAPIPVDATVGERVDIGATVWDPAAGELAATTGSYVRIHPATGSAEPEEGPSRSDWPGHLVASVRIPAGGAGRVEIGFEAEECRDDGGCQMIRVPFANGGVGPPPEAPRALLVVAGFQQFSEAAVAGVSLPLEVAVSPRGNWPIEQLGLPDRLVVTATRLRGPQLATAEVRSTGTAGIYGGTIVVPEAAETVLQVAIPGTGTDSATIATSTTRIQVEAAPTSSAPSSETPSAPPWPWIVGGLVAAALGALVIRKAFADL